MQHNCAVYHCTTVRERPVQQEREMVAKLAFTICHNVPDNLLLNCMQMRSYQYIQHFFQAPAAENHDQAIHEGTAREIADRHGNNLR